jgi:hypothetical protein
MVTEETKAMVTKADVEMAKERKFGIVGLGLAGLLLATGCVSDGSESGQVSEQEVVVEQDSPEVEIELPEGVTAQGVVLAAYLLSSGDIALAVEEALVSPEEVELARKAIAENNLQEWVDRASEERK